MSLAFAVHVKWLASLSYKHQLETTQQQFVYTLGDYLVYPDSNALVDNDGKKEVLSQLTFTLLLKLIEDAPNIVPQNKLMAAVWGNSLVSDETLQQRIKLLRKALKDNPSAPKYIVTVRNQGYKLIMPVKKRAITENQQKQNSQPTIWKYVSMLLLIIIAMTLLMHFYGYDNNEARQVMGENNVSDKYKTLIIPFKHLDGSKPTDTFTQELFSQLALAISYNDKVEVINHGLSIDDFSQKSSESLATDFSATHILTGRIDLRENKVFVSLTLKSRNTKQTIWSQNISTEFTDKKNAQKNIVQDLSNSLAVFTGSRDVKMPVTPESNLTAYDYLLKADEYLNRMQKADIELAIELSQKSIDLDPELALSHYTLGLAKLIYRSDWGGPVSLIDEAIIAAEKTIESDPSLSHGYFLLGMAYQNKAWIAPFEQWEEKAQKAYKQALKVNPDDVNAKNALVNNDYRYKHLGKVLEVLYESMRKHPDSVHIHINIGTIFEDLNYNSVAIEWYEKALLIQPDYYTALMKLSSLHLALGQYDLSLEFAENLLKRYPDKSDYLFQKAAVYLFKKEFNKAITLYQQGDFNIPKDYNLSTGYYIYPYINLAYAYQQTDQRSKSLELITDLKTVINKNLTEFTYTKSDSLVQLAMLELLNNNTQNAYEHLLAAIDEGFIADDWLQTHPIFKPLIEEQLMPAILAKIAKLIDNYRQQVFESGILDKETMHSQLNNNIL